MLMKKLSSYILITVLLTTVISCQKRFEELQKNPNIPTAVPPDLILNKLINGLSSGVGGVEPWGAVARYNQYFCRNYQYYGDNRYSWNNGPFDVYVNTLKNVVQMETEAAKTESIAKAYQAVAKFFRAYYFYQLTSLMGDVPMSEALKGLDEEEEVLTPKYDTQKEVFLQVLKWLEEANNDFAGLIAVHDASLKGDIFYDGDYDQWRKLVNTFKLRVLIALSKKESDTDLRIKERFDEVVKNPSNFPIFAGSEDDLAYKYIANVNNYPTNITNYGNDALRYNMASTYVDACTEIKDPRVLITCEPAWKLVNDNGWSPVDFRAYVASGTGESQDIMESKAIRYSISHINRYRYYRGFTGENFIIVGYTEMCFNIAEAINRGWTTGNAEQWYKNGIQSSIQFYGIKNGSNDGHYLPIGKDLSKNEWITVKFDFGFDEYYNDDKVAYTTGAAGLQKIWKQKYIAFFQNSGWEAYFNYRRTGVPTFSTGVGVGNNGMIPKRWAYPSSEQVSNGVNLKEALDRQYSGNNTINETMWLIK